MMITLWALSPPARAQVDAISGAPLPPATVPPPSGTPRAPNQELVPPEVLTPTVIPYPEDAPALSQPLLVEVVIRVDARGEVRWVRLSSALGEPGDAVFSRAVLYAASGFRFRPALFRGEPVEVEINFQQTFLPEKSEPADKMIPVLDARLSGHVIEMGTRNPVAMAHVVVSVGDEDFFVVSDEEGAFGVNLPAGESQVEVLGPAHHRFLVNERIDSNEALAVEYVLERLSYEPFETVIVAKRERRVISRTTLRERELKKVPGTFGDPFRVIATLPGVTQVISLVAYPVVRGSSPGNTGFLLDGVRVPQLFHMLAGPAVIHPELIERVDFYPGTFGADYGGYIGGIVDGITKRSRPGDGNLIGSVSLTESALFLRGPLDFIGSRGVIAGRVGYPALVMQAFDVPVSLVYWDYQARLDGRLGPGRWKVFTFGSFDELKAEKQVSGDFAFQTLTTFHRLDLSYRVGGEHVDEYKLVLGIDQTRIPANDQTSNLTTLLVEPRARWSFAIYPGVDLKAGLDWTYRHFDSDAAIEDVTLGDIVEDAPGGNLLTSDYYRGGVFVSLPWTSFDDLIVVPGLRFDFYGNNDTTQWSLDPRLAVRFRLMEILGGDLWLKAGGGFYHQPPRMFLPIPGFDELALSLGLLASLQASAGLEMPLGAGFALDAQGYFQWMDPVLFDLAINSEPTGIAGGHVGPNEPIIKYESDWDFGRDVLTAQRGRSYGLEILIKHDGSGRLFGWLSYTVSWAEREAEGGWVPFDFDRRHVLNLVAGVSLPRNWDAAVRLQVASGRPFTDIRGFNQARGPAYYRIDLRIDKRVVWEDWLFDFYVDLINVTLAPEQVDPRIGQSFRIPIPTVGVRGVF